MVDSAVHVEEAPLIMSGEQNPPIGWQETVAI